MQRRAGRAAAVLRSAGLCSAALLLTAESGCAPAPVALPNGSGDTIVLLSARSFDGSDRVARQLEALVSASDVLGPAQIVVREASDGELSGLAPALAGLQGVRAVVAVLGDLSVLDGVDPSIPDRGPDRLTSRTVRPERLDEAVSAVREQAARLGAPLVLATAPVGMQGRVEVPELHEVAEHLRARGAVVELAAPFRTLEPAPLFTNGIDRLDAYGHDELARVLYHALCEDPGPVPPRDASERSARAEARALQAFAAGRFELFAHETATTSVGPPPTARHAMRRAALAAAASGPDAGVDALDGVDGLSTPVPGLALWRALRDEPHDGPVPEDPFEAALVATIRAVTRGEPTAPELAAALVDSAPHRLEAWIVLQLAVSRAPFPRDVRSEARRNLRQFPRSAVADTLTWRLFEAWPATLTSLPAVYLASRPFDGLQPTGPILEAARRCARFGYTSDAYHLMLEEMGTQRFPPSWIEARAAWEPR